MAEVRSAMTASRRHRTVAGDRAYPIPRIRLARLPAAPGRPVCPPNLLAANLAGGKEGPVGYLKKQAELGQPFGFHDGAVSSCPRCWREIRTRRSSSSAYYTRDGD